MLSNLHQYSFHAYFPGTFVLGINTFCGIFVLPSNNSSIADTYLDLAGRFHLREALSASTDVVSSRSILAPNNLLKP